MANTYTQIYIQVIFSPKHRESLINKTWENDLYKYITGIVQNNKHKMLAINGMPDHIHVFMGLNPTQSISDLVRDIKANSSLWINKNKLSLGKFEWQAGYGAFSYGHSQIDNVISYVMNQKEHHGKNTFREEYLLFLKKFDVEFNPQYLFNYFD